ncbi:hypothetical protein TNIN_302041 [Trichonephila inaurata madagascariensis]|uniref:Uncharacterized protein n=1 Tax=Trichonephila inaurata madagascariensis TaxID=2747483 RepID=A0A8X7CF89_9ARAC|nr:hypothetical protein TNIN_302041 [Trichonephila inaurata madagascariensis]
MSSSHSNCSPVLGNDNLFNIFLLQGIDRALPNSFLRPFHPLISRRAFELDRHSPSLLGELMGKPMKYLKSPIDIRLRNVPPFARAIEFLFLPAMKGLQQQVPPPSIGSGKR